MKLLIVLITLLLNGCAATFSHNPDKDLLFTLSSDGVDLGEYKPVVQIWALSEGNKRLGSLKVKNQYAENGQWFFSASKINRAQLVVSAVYTHDEGISNCQTSLKFPAEESNSFLLTLEDAKLEKGRCVAVLTDASGQEIARKTNSLFEVEINIRSGVQFEL